MSPEQARGKAVDKRADIWAFGCVLFEMVTGRRPFDGEDATEVLGAVVRLEPNWDALPPDVPTPVRTLLHSCLAKDPRQRVADISIARFVLDKAASLAAPAPATSVAPAPSQPRRERLVWIAALAIAAMVIVALAIPTVRYLRQTPPPETRTEIVTPATNRLASFALSPDGRQIVFLASGDGASRLWLRSLATTTAQPLAGTEGAKLPFWSPDSRSIGFFAAGALKRLDVGGGAAQTLAPAISGCGGTWHPDGVIVFAPSTTTALMRVSANGGDAVAVTTLGPRQQSHRAPQFLPDGRRILFYVQGAPDTAGIYLGALDGSPPIRLTPAESSAVLLPPERALPAGFAKASGCSGCERGRSWPSGWKWSGLRSRASRSSGRRRGRERIRGGSVGLRDGTGGLPDGSRQPAATDLGGPVRHGAGHHRRRGPEQPDPSPTVTRWPSRRGEPCGAGQPGHLADGQRPHDPRHVRRGDRLFPRVVARRRADCVSLEPDGSEPTFTRRACLARAWRSVSSPPISSRLLSAGRQTVASFCTSASIPRPTSICGLCRWRAIARRRCF